MFEGKFSSFERIPAKHQISLTAEMVGFDNKQVLSYFTNKNKKVSIGKKINVLKMQK